jgi:hypothetical protein
MTDLPSRTTTAPGSLLTQAITKHSKLFVFAFLLALPPNMQAGTDLGSAASSFADPFSRHLQSKRLDPLVLCRPTGIHQLTCFAIVDGHKTRSAAGHLAAATALWASVLGLPYAHGLLMPCVHADGQAGLMIRKDRPEWEHHLAYAQRWAGNLFPQPPT